VHTYVQSLVEKRYLIAVV